MKNIILALSVIASVTSMTNAQSMTLNPVEQSETPASIEEVVRIKEIWEPRFFSIDGIVSSGVTLCSMSPTPLQTIQKYCISIGATSQSAMEAFETEFPGLEVDGIPMIPRLTGPIVIHPGVVVAD